MINKQWFFKVGKVDVCEHPFANLVTYKYLLCATENEAESHGYQPCKDHIQKSYYSNSYNYFCFLISHEAKQHDVNF